MDGIKMKRKIFLTVFLFILLVLNTCKKKGDCEVYELDTLIIGSDTICDTMIDIIPDLTEEECEEKGGFWTENY